ncbi:PDxFFG protein [Mycoplasma nasistruthionis]
MSLGILAAVSGVVAGSAIAYAENSDEKLGPTAPVDKNLFSNNYARIYEGDKLTPEIAILDPRRKVKVANLNHDTQEYSFVSDPETKYSFDDFFNEYYNRYNESFVLSVRYGSFSFYDEYVLAVHPKQFVDFTNWFIKNVAWGPDLLTLDSFRIVPGVEQNGNAITLGSHSTLHKEVSEIKFFPDAFFGSLPMYSGLSGRGNAADALTYSTFSGEVPKDIVDEFLKSVATASAVKNSSILPNNEPYLNITIPAKLNNKKFLVAQPQNADARTIENQTVFLPLNTTAEQFEAIKSKYAQEFEESGIVSLDSFKPATIVSAVSSKDERTNENRFTVRFNFDDSKLNEPLVINLRAPLFQGRSYTTYQTFVQQIADNTKHFLDFYDYTSYIGEKMFIFDDASGNRHYYASFVQALNSNSELDDLTVEQQRARVKQVTVSNFSVEKREFANGFSLTVNYDAPNGEKLLDVFLANEQNNYRPANFEAFKDAIGYVGSISPIIADYTPEDISLVDKEGNPIKGLAARKYQIYNEVYNGLIDKVIEKYPHLVKDLNGPHIAKKVNDQGFYEYTLENGPYKGFLKSDRIGLPLVLGALVPGFKGIPTDFLKYVATHEYGHHLTLDQGQSWNDTANAVLVGGLSTRGGASDSSFYSFEALKNYLDARTNIEIQRANAIGQDKEDGKFLKFKFGKLDQNGKVTGYKLENPADIWGSTNPKADIFEVLNNPKRRFLQSFEGMVNAAKERNVALGDLFLANSFDTDSGTLNPQITGTSKTFKKSTDANGNVSYSFSDLTAKAIIEQLTDGAGNPLTNAIKFSDDNTFTLNIIETSTTEAGTMVTKVNLFDANNKPIIKVPLNEVLDPESLAYINQQVQVVGNALQSIIDRNMFDSGWNSANTFIGGGLNSGITDLLSRDLISGYFEKVKARKNPIEINPQANDPREQNLPEKRSAFTYLALRQSIDGSASDIFRYFRTSIALPITEPDSGYNFLDESDAAKVAIFNNGQDFFTSKRFTIPYTSTSLISRDVHREIDINRIADQINAPRTSGRLQRSFANAIAQAFGYLNNANDPSSTANRDYLIYFDENNRPVELNTFIPLITQSIDRFKTVIKKVGFNPFSRNLNETDRSLLSASSTNLKIASSHPDFTRDRNTVATLNLEDLLEWASLDYSQATYDQTTGKYNWNVDYVKTKFNLADVSKIIAEDTTLRGLDKNEAGSSDQAKANYIIKKFRNSNLFLVVKDFNPVTELVANRAFLSKEYGITFLNTAFTKYYVEDLNAIPENDRNRLNFDVVKLQAMFAELTQKYNLSAEDAKYLNTQDLYTFLGNIIYFTNLGNYKTPTFDLFGYGVFSAGEPSSDVLNYNSTRVETLLNDKFTDYIYSIAETLTRDYVQTTYIPDFNEFGNTPVYMKGLSEAISGLDYIVDGTALEFLRHKANSQENMAKGILGAVNGLLYDKYFEKTMLLQIESNFKIAKLREQLDVLRAERNRFIVDSPEYNAKNAELTKVTSEYAQEVDSKQRAIATIREEIFKNWNTRRFLEEFESRDSNYFGQFISRNNGFFKDRFEKEKIGMTLYDDNRQAIQDTNIRIKDFQGQAVTSRPKAFFISQLLNYGVSKRTISGFFRNKELDAIALYGYIPNELAKQAKFVEFTDVETNEKLYVPINIDKTNNIFYYETQGDASSKVTIEDLGYTSWLSDYSLMGKYRNTLLKPKHQYYVSFANENKKTIQDFELGNVTQMGENGKAIEQSPVKVYAEQKDGIKTNKVILSVDFQFNISH